MTEVVLDRKTLAKLRSAKKRVAVRDKTGNLWGYFTPAKKKSSYEGIEIPYLPEEAIRRRKKEMTGKTYTTARVLKYLKALEKR
jgi:hypothetical protein